MENKRDMWMTDIWRCPECGDAANALDPLWRWNGKAWEHHHGYPIGHIVADYIGKEIPEKVDGK